MVGIEMNKIKDTEDNSVRNAQSLDLKGVPFERSDEWSVDEGADLGAFLQHGVAEIQKDGQRALVAAPDTDAAGNAAIVAASLAGLPIHRVDRYAFGRLLEAADRMKMCEDAGLGLYRRDKLNSALYGIRPWQFAAAGAMLALAAYGTHLDPMAALNTGMAVIVAIMAVLVVFRMTCMFASFYWQFKRTDDIDVRQLDDDALPSYSILVPMLRERETTLRGLVSSLSRIDYPTDRLQVLFILEETDQETRAIVDSIHMPEWFSVILIPDADPHTKGKACNYAMNFVTGDYFTIYDAEDHPDPRQLKKAVAAFEKAGEKVVCVQSKLNFYNVKENWLTRMFTLDYSAWYYFMLPGMDALNLPICLGGTSNHFKSRVVRDLCVWDAYNVTEDADFGLRIAKSGMKTILIDSTTYEEANTSIPNWIRQRTRWMKGYMLTYLVHMRQPLALLKRLGLWGFLGMQLFVAGNFVGNLIIPPLLLTTLLWASAEIWGWTSVDFFPDEFWLPAIFALVVGNLGAIGFAMAAGIRRGIPSLVLYALTSPLYWALGVIATYRALWQVIFNPFHWEKTEHGLSKVDSGILLEQVKTS
jgi:cellulose synthase/poly-beta-1,6-N-acetylglucosamine synthase-like glycosyltransferase